MPVPVEIKIATREVVASGSFVVRTGRDETTLSIYDLKFYLLFDVSETGDARVEASVPDGKSIRFQFQNFNSPLGHAWHGTVGTVNQRKLALDLFVHTLNAKDFPRTVTFTFALGEAAT